MHIIILKGEGNIVLPVAMRLAEAIDAAKRLSIIQPYVVVVSDQGCTIVTYQNGKEY